MSLLRAARSIRATPTVSIAGAGKGVRMSDKNWYQRKQAEFVTAAANFAAQLIAQGEDMDVSAEQIAGFGVLNTAFQSAYTAAMTPETRTAVAIEQKDL